MHKPLFFLVILLALAGGVARGEELVGGDSTIPNSSTDDVNPSPVLSADMRWAGVMVIAVVGLFLAAAVIGPIVRLEVPAAVPQAFSHHEDPAKHSGFEGDERERG